MTGPEIYYDSNEQDLVWLPKHSAVIAEVARELMAQGTHYDSTICGDSSYGPRSATIDKSKSYAPYVAWSCHKPEPLLNHPRIKETLMKTTRTVPTKEQVLKAASECPQTKEALKILFPQDFQQEFDWEDFYSNPFKHLKVSGRDEIRPSEELLRACEERGMKIFCSWWPSMDLSMMARFFDHLYKAYQKGGTSK